MILCKHASDDPCRWRRRKEARPEEILDAAFNLFCEKGFSATRMTDVARQAGISKGTLYLYFDSKDMLLRSVVQEFITPELERVEDQVSHYSGPVDVLLTNLVHGWWQSIGETRLSAIPKLIIAESGNFPELADFFVQNIVKRARKLFEQVIEMGMDSGEFVQLDSDSVARLVIAPLVYTVIWQHSLKPFDDDFDARDVIDLHIQFILRALRK